VIDLLKSHRGRFATVLADPPWRFTNRTGKMAPEHKRLSRYGTMTFEEIMALPIDKLVLPTAHLYLWCPNALLPDGVRKVAIEAGVTDYWWKYVGHDGCVVGIDTFGESAPAPALFKHFHFTPENVAAAERLAAWTAKRGGYSPAQVALAWVLRNPQVSSAIIGATSVPQLEENVKALEVQLSDHEWREVEGAIAGKAAKAAKPSGKKSAARARPRKRR
jgi:hypothetical protein